MLKCSDPLQKATTPVLSLSRQLTNCQLRGSTFPHTQLWYMQAWDGYFVLFAHSLSSSSPATPLQVHAANPNTVPMVRMSEGNKQYQEYNTRIQCSSVQGQ